MDRSVRSEFNEQNRGHSTGVCPPRVPGTARVPRSARRHRRVCYRGCGRHTHHPFHRVKTRPPDNTSSSVPPTFHNAPSSRPWVPLDDGRVGPSSGQIAHPRVREARQAHRTCHRTRRSASQGQYLGPTASCVAGRATRSHLLISKSCLITPSRSSQPYRWPHRGIVRLPTSLYPRINPCSPG